MTNSAGANDASNRTPPGSVSPARPFTERLPVEWNARYRARGTPLWLRCRVVDISIHGAGLVLVDDSTDPLHTIVIDLQPPGRADGIVLRAEVRHSSTAEGQRRIGIEFWRSGPLDEQALRDEVARLAELR